MNLTAYSLETSYCRINLNKRGACEYTKISFPLKYGIYSEIETSHALLQFNLNHEIIRA
ncbi:MAG: radical SAM domain-containing protein, partial [Desulfamplus sp.]|nr:radical SAM domain-containing protein [Desulfamplus sp.]